MRATLESLLEDQADFASMSKWIHCGNSYSKKCSSMSQLELDMTGVSPIRP